MNVEMFIAKTPGQDCATANKSINSSRFIQRFLSTTSLSIIGIMPYPPPSVKSPIRKNTLKSRYGELRCPLSVLSSAINHLPIIKGDHYVIQQVLKIISSCHDILLESVCRCQRTSVGKTFRTCRSMKKYYAFFSIHLRAFTNASCQGVTWSVRRRSSG